MATNATQTQQTSAHAASGTSSEKDFTLPRQPHSAQANRGADPARKPAGMGLPCSKCHAYYSVDLDRCPVCQHNQRVSPVVPRVSPKSVQNTSSPGAPAALEKVREEFLKQFNAPAGELRANSANLPESVCTAPGHQPGEPPNPEICEVCYERLQERLDICAAALQINLKEAAQIIYDAVWADPSDPNKTYQNAAQALLTELRKRSGMNSLKGPLEP